MRSRILLLLAYVGVTLLMVAPLVTYSALGSASYEGDARLIIWTLAWDDHAILARLPLFDSNIFYPAAHSLAYNEHLFGLSLFTLPLYAATHNPVLSYNIVWLLSFVLNGIVTHVWLRRHTRHPLSAACGSVIFTFAFYKMLHGHGHLHLVWTWLMPASAICLERWSERPSLLRAGGWAVTVVLQALTSWYLAVLVTMVQAALLLGLLPSSWKDGRLRHWWHLAVVTAMAGAAVWPFARMYRTMPEAQTGEIAEYSADLAAYLMPPENTWVGQLWLAHLGPGPGSIWGEHTVFVGWTALIMSGLGVGALVQRRQWRRLCVYGGLVVLAVALSAGPAGGSWSPFSLLHAVPGLQAFRAPARFALLVLFGLAMLAAAGADRLAGSSRRGRAALLVIIAVMLSEWYVVKFPGGKPQPFEVPAIYRVEALANARSMVSLPQYRATPDWFRGADYLYFSTVHWRPIVNGFGRAEPAGYAHVVSHMNAFPGPNNARTMRTLGIEYVVLHAARYPDGAAEILRLAHESPEYSLITRVGTDYLFKVRDR